MDPVENLKQRIEATLKEVRYNAWLIKNSKLSNEQFVIDYEDELNRYSNIDYNEL